MGGRDVTDVSVRNRNLAMVYQQFINYPSLTVYENIASPLKLRRRPTWEIKQRVGTIAETLHLSALLDRRPAELSGGQQQRVALARALAKDAELLLLDEPLVNLDYKLREELRFELTLLFREGKTTVVYATTEPLEALQLGGRTAILHEGTLIQYGDTLDTFMRPMSLAAARAFSDPPLNVMVAGRNDLAAILSQLNVRATQIGVRAHHVRVSRRSERDLELTGRIELAEMSGSDTYLHVAHAQGSLVAQLPGIHEFRIGADCSMFFDPADLFGFDEHGTTVFQPKSASESN